MRTSACDRPIGLVLLLLLCFGELVQDIIPAWISCIASLTFSFRHFVVLDLKFSCLIHFELMFVDYEKYGSNFIERERESVLPAPFVEKIILTSLYGLGIFVCIHVGPVWAFCSVPSMYALVLLFNITTRQECVHQDHNEMSPHMSEWLKPKTQ